MAANNSIHLLGNLGKDVELQYTPKGAAKATFTIAVTRYGGGGEDKKTDWFDVAIYGKSAESAKNFLRKGSRVSLEGRLETYEFTGKQDGQKRKGFVVVAQDWAFADSKKGSDSSPEAVEESSGELPF